jgi:hypothetical protein
MLRPPKPPKIHDDGTIDYCHWDEETKLWRRRLFQENILEADFKRHLPIHQQIIKNSGIDIIF